MRTWTISLDRDQFHMLSSLLHKQQRSRVRPIQLSRTSIGLLLGLAPTTGFAITPEGFARAVLPTGYLFSSYAVVATV
jgi:hypothetical protein